MFKDNIDITEITPNIFICGKIWKNRTEKLSRRNNINEIKTYLTNKFGNRYMLYTFGRSNGKEDIDLKLKENFGNLQEWDPLEFDLNNALKISKSVFGWLKLNLTLKSDSDKNLNSKANIKNVCVFEDKDNLNKFVFIMACILKYIKSYETSVKAFNFIITKRYKTKKFCVGTIIRYLKYFDDILNLNSNLNQIKLNNKIFRLKQVIVYSVPTNSEDHRFSPSFIIYSNNNKIPINHGRVMMDENYIVACFDDVFLDGDINVQLYDEENLNNDIINKKTGKFNDKSPIFETLFNTKFLGQGIHRFNPSNVIFSTPENILKKNIDNNFFIDIVLLETLDDSKIFYNKETTTIGNLKILSDHLSKKEDPEILKILVKEGYNLTYSRLFLQLGYNIDEVRSIIVNINEKEKNLIRTNENTCKSILKLDTESYFNQSVGSSTISKELSALSISKSNLLKKPFHKIEYSDNEWIESCDIELLPEKIIFKSSDKIEENYNKLDNTNLTQKNSKMNRGPPKRKNAEDVIENETSVTAIKSLHWMALPKIENTVFSGLNNIKISFNQTKFEEWFCEPVSARNKNSPKEAEQTKCKYTRTIIKNENRLFLISIFAKTLEKRGIDIYELEHLIYKESYCLEVEDLESILKILPCDDEIDSINKYISSELSSDSYNDSIKLKLKEIISELSESEQFLVHYKDKINLRRTVQILVFERKLEEENNMILPTLKNIRRVYNTILESYDLLVILKLILELGNLINYKYSNLSINRNRLRKKFTSFRISSLAAVINYKGRKNDNTLVAYICETLQEYRPETFKILRDINGIYRVKKDDFGDVKNNINRLVKKFRECRDSFCKIDFESFESVDKQTSENRNENVKIDISKPQMEIEEAKNDKIYSHMKNFLGFAHENINGYTKMYKEIVFLGEIVKRKFGEDDDVFVVIENLSIFMIKLREEYQKTYGYIKY